MGVRREEFVLCPQRLLRGTQRSALPGSCLTSVVCRRRILDGHQDRVRQAPVAGRSLDNVVGQPDRMPSAAISSLPVWVNITTGTYPAWRTAAGTCKPSLHRS